VTLSVSCQFPRQDTLRVEVTEVIRNIKIRATNTTAHELSVDLIAAVRHIGNPDTGRLTSQLLELLKVNELVLAPQQDREFFVDDVVVSPENFASVLGASASVKERTCDILTVVRLAHASAELNLPRKYKLAQIPKKFYLGVDPPGFSVWRECLPVNDPNNGKQSWHEGDVESGYVFKLNIGHSEYNFLQAKGDKEVLGQYTLVQQLRQAYLVCFENDIYDGPAEPYRDLFKGDSPEHVPASDVAAAFDTIIGTALNLIRRG
jgi:hypothetical protein